MRLVRLDQTAEARLREYMNWCIENLRWNGIRYDKICVGNHELPMVGIGPTFDLIKEWVSWHRRDEVFH